jgi:hypothetical protein
MVLHFAAMAAILVDTVSQAPVVVQCPQPSPEPWWKWLLQFILSVIPVAGGVGIAVWTLRATSRRDHKRWVLDQKKSEWRELFIAFTEVKKEFLPIYKDEKTAQAFVEKWDEMEQRIDFIAMPFIFVAQKLIDIEFYGDWQDFK